VLGGVVVVVKVAVVVGVLMVVEVVVYDGRTELNTIFFVLPVAYDHHHHHHYY